MSRPTKEAQYEQAEQWMLHTFGYRMRDYAQADLTAPISVAVVEVDRVFIHGGVRELLQRWRSEDVKSNAGRKPYLDETAALALILLQLRIGKATLFSEMARTVMRMSPAQRRAIGIKHDDQHRLLYDRIGGAVYRLMALVDEFPGPRNSVPSRDEFRAIVAARDPEKMARRRERMQELFNAPLEGSWAMLPSDIRKKSDGNFAQDATLVALQGKAGNPSAKNLDERRRSINYDGGYYHRGGNHAAITSGDARAFKKSQAADGSKVVRTKDATWGVEAEVVRMVANVGGEDDQFPLFTLAAGAHIPGAIRGEGARLAQSIVDRGHPLNHWVVDRAYPNGLPHDFHIAIRKLGGKLVFDYKVTDLGLQTHTADGFIMVSGRWFLDSLPEILQMADIPMRNAQTAYEAAMKKLDKMVLTDKEAAELRTPIEHAYSQAKSLYHQQLAQRAKYMLLPKGKMASDGIRRYLIPTGAPGYAKWKAKKGAHQGKTVTMLLPTVAQLEESPRIGGVKDEQHYHYGTTDWAQVYALRNTVESTNANAKRSQFEDLGDPNKRSVPGNTFTYIVIILALVAENLRQAVSFFKRKLTLGRVTSKTTYAPDMYWQSNGHLPPPEVEPPPLR